MTALPNSSPAGLGTLFHSPHFVAAAVNTLWVDTGTRRSNWLTWGGSGSSRRFYALGMVRPSGYSLDWQALLTQFGPLEIRRQRLLHPSICGLKRSLATRYPPKYRYFYLCSRPTPHAAQGHSLRLSQHPFNSSGCACPRLLPCVSFEKSGGCTRRLLVSPPRIGPYTQTAHTPFLSGGAE